MNKSVFRVRKLLKEWEGEIKTYLISYISKVRLDCQFQILDLLPASSGPWVSYTTFLLHLFP